MAAGYTLAEATKEVAVLFERHAITRPQESEARSKYYPPDTIERWRDDARKSEGYVRRAEKLANGHPRWPKDRATLKPFVDAWMEILVAEFKERGRI